MKASTSGRASAFSLSAAFPEEAFQITQGDTVIGGLHGSEARHHHCAHCKSWLFTRWGDMVNLRAPMLDDPAWFEPFIETWTRDFSGRRFRSRMSRRGRELVERFGPLRFRFALVRDGGGLGMEMRGWSCLGLPLPIALAPRSHAGSRRPICLSARH